MDYLIDGNLIYVSLHRGDPLVKSLTQFAIDRKLKSASFTGIGAVTDVMLGYFDLREKKYIEKKFQDNYEMISCIGNIAQKDGAPFIHAHITMGDRNFRVFGGHCFRAIISVVGEFIVIPGEKEIKRYRNRGIGLAIWDFGGCHYDPSKSH